MVQEEGRDGGREKDRVGGEEEGEREKRTGEKGREKKGGEREGRGIIAEKEEMSKKYLPAVTRSLRRSNNFNLRTSVGVWCTSH